MVDNPMAATESPEKWFWWAGLNDEEYTLAGPHLHRSHALDDAYGDTEEGDQIFLIEATADDEVDSFTGLYPFLKTRNASVEIRPADALLAPRTPREVAK